MRDLPTPSLRFAVGALAFAALVALLAPAPAIGADEDDGPELDRQRIATCEARGGRLARNQYGQQVCKDAKVKLKPYLKQHPELAAPAPGVTPRPPVYTPTTTGTLTVPAGAPTMDGGHPGDGVVELHPPPPPNTATRESPYQPAPTGTHTVPAGAPAVPPLPPALQPAAPGGQCYLRSCLFSSYTKSCQCQEFRSSELCQFKEAEPGGTCATGQGMTTALCPAGYSCINNRCRKEPTC
jgi:hypothetical protein